MNDKFKIKKLIDGPLSVWVVDGGQVRDEVYIDFIAGGHGYVYDFIPKDEIWIDNDTDKDEIPFVLLHELVERYCMSTDKGCSYEEAHDVANTFEGTFRQHPEALADTLEAVLAEEEAKGA
jgi:hypothetical protein